MTMPEEFETTLRDGWSESLDKLRAEQTQLDRLEEKVDRILAVMETTEVQIRKIVEQVGPALEALENSPIFKMLGGKK